MRSKRKVISFALAVSLVVTSAPTNLTGIFAKAADATSTRLVSWDDTNRWDGVLTEAGKVTTEGAVYIAGEEYDNANNYSAYLNASSAVNTLIEDETKLNKAFGLSGDTVSDAEYTYQWYVDNTVQEDETNAYYSYYEYLYNDGKTDTVFKCEIKMDSVTFATAGVKYMTDASGVTEEDYTVTYQYTYRYNGPCEETIAAGKYLLSDYVTGIENVKDETYAYDRVRSDYAWNDNDSNWMSVDELSREGDNVSYDYQWIAYSIDGDKYVCDDRTDTNYIHSYDAKVIKTFYDENGYYIGEKVVDKYECAIVVRYNRAKIASVTKTFDFEYQPVKVYNSETTTEVVRESGKATFTVNAEIMEDSDICKGLSYQWYTVDKDGKETAIAGEESDTLKKKITEYDTKYKCVITAKFAPGYNYSYSTSRLFEVVSSTGYKVTKISNRWNYLSIGEKTTLSIEAAVDAGYTLSYSWYTYVDGEKKEVGTANSLEVTTASLTDFKDYYLDVTVKKGESVVNTYSYSYYLWHEVDFTISANDGMITAVRGEDVSLYADITVASAYTVEKTWYKKIAESPAFTIQWDDEKNEQVTVFESEFTEPTYDYRTEYGKWDEETGINYQYYVYYTKVTPEADGKVKIAGKDATGTPVDTRGEYMCEVEFKYTEAGNTEPSWGTYYQYGYEIVYDSDLYAYAKNETVKAAVGAAARLEVVANNKDTALYPITYKWEKYDTATKTYVELKDADGAAITTAAYDIAAVTDADFTTYRVTVDDIATSKVVEISLIENGITYVPYTPEKSVYYKAIGEEAAFKVDFDITAGTNVFYEWYRTEKHYYDNYSGDYEDVDWELLNQDTNEYKFTVAGDTDYTTYKCLVTFKNIDDAGNTYSFTDEFYFNLEKMSDYALEPLTPGGQYKKVGSSVSYAVRMITDDAKYDETKTTYTWYRNDKKVEGVTTANYDVAAMTAEDFGEISVAATYVDANGETQTTARLDFETYLYTDVVLTAVFDYLEVVLGTNVELAVLIDNPSALALTYQWYCENQKIYGATSATYTIPAIGSSEVGKSYYCDIYLDGMLIGVYEVWVVEDTKPANITLDYAEGKEEYTYAVAGSTAELGVVATSDKSLGLKYQWYKVDDYYNGYDEDEDDYYSHYYDAVAIGGATEAILKFDKVTLNDYGSYICIVTDSQGNKKWIGFRLNQTTNLELKNDAYFDIYDTIAYETTMGGSVTLNATATIDSAYTMYYQWYKYTSDEGFEMLYDQTSATLTLDAIDESKLGYYYCDIYDSIGNYVNQSFYVYVNTNLVVTPSLKNVDAKDDGSVKMYVKASASEAITYQWYKYKTVKTGDAEYDAAKDSDGDGVITDWFAITGATTDAYSLAKITEADYGEYRIVVSTKGETYTYTYRLEPKYMIPDVEKFVEEGTEVAVETKIGNAATDVPYAYTWYVQEPATGAYKKVDCTTAVYTANAPQVLFSDAFTYEGDAAASQGYAEVGYKCVIKNGDTILDTVTNYVKVLPTVTYGTALPETTHNFDAEYDMQAYKAEGATSLTITFDAQSMLDEERLYIIDNTGAYTFYDYYELNGNTALKVTVQGDSAIFLINGNQAAMNYGYKVASIEAKFPAKKSAKKATIGVKETYSVKLAGATYKSNKPKVAKVSKKGVVTGLKTGKAKITVTTAKKVITYTITVKKAPKKIQKVTPAKKVLKVKKSFKIKVKLPKGTASNKITFTSSNKRVATVNAKGKVVAKKKGKCKITVKTYNGKKKVVKVTVKKK